MIVMDERILSARDAEKLYARSGGFDAGEMGMLGVVAAHGVEFFYAPTRRNTATSEFDVSLLQELPAVDIHYSYAGTDGGAVHEGVKGVVVATTGFTPDERAYYESLQRRGIVIAATFPSGENVASPPSARDSTIGIAVERLSPLHARILLMLALTKTKDPIRHPADLQRVLKATSQAAAGDCRNDGDLGAVLCGRAEVLQETDVFTIHIDIDEAAQSAGIVANAVPDAGKLAFQPVNDFLHRAGFHFDDFRSAGVFSEWSGNDHLKRHGQLLLHDALERIDLRSITSGTFERDGFGSLQAVAGDREHRDAMRIDLALLDQLLRRRRW